MSDVAVDVEGEFGAQGEPARVVTYRAKVRADASEDAIRALMQDTDKVAEIRDTLRGTHVILAEVEVESV